MVDTKKLKEFASGKGEKKGPLPKSMKGKGHAPIVGKDDHEDDEHDEPDGDEQVDVAAVAKEIADGHGNKKLAEMDCEPGEDGAAPSFAVDKDIWDKAKSAVGPEEGSDYEDYWLVVAAVYEKMGGEIAEGGGDAGNGEEEPEDEDEEDDDEEGEDD